MIWETQIDASGAVPCDGYSGTVIREGNAAVRLSGGFDPEEFVPVLTWNADVRLGGESMRFWPVYEKEGGVALRFVVCRFDRESGFAAERSVYEETELQEPCPLGKRTGQPGVTETGVSRYQIVLEAKGGPGGTGGESDGREQMLRIGPIYLRFELLSFDLLSKGARGEKGTTGPQETRGIKGTAGPQEVKGAVQAQEPGGAQEAELQRERIVVGGRNEIFTFYKKGNGQAPLRVLFAGTNGIFPDNTFSNSTSSENEDPIRSILKNTKTPCLILADPRLHGEGFFLGSPAYEEGIKRIIDRTLGELGLGGEQLVMSGVSFGASGAAYYGSFYRPRALLLAEPVLRIGTMIHKEKFVRNGSFPESLDLFLLLRHELGLEDLSDQEAADEMDAHLNEMDAHLWDRIAEGDFRGTEIAVCYMEEDDRDDSAFEDLRSLLTAGDRHVRIYGKSQPGRHVPVSGSRKDRKMISGMTEWLELRYEAIAASIAQPEGPASAAPGAVTGT